MRVFAAAALLLCALGATAQDNLPPGPGQPLVLEACVQCHDFKWIVAQRKTEAAWRRTVDEMIWRGAPLMPGEADVVTRYLLSLGDAKRETRTATTNDQFAKDLPPGPGRALVLSACVQCHDLGVTVAQRKTREGWRRSVEQMARLGAHLNGSEIQVVTKYLAHAFGPNQRPSGNQ